jgi:hypothetical protein
MDPTQLAQPFTICVETRLPKVEVSAGAGPALAGGKALLDQRKDEGRGDWQGMGLNF